MGEYEWMATLSQLNRYEKNNKADSSNAAFYSRVYAYIAFRETNYIYIVIDRVQFLVQRIDMA